jgi:hypothetical protein
MIRLFFKTVSIDCFKIILVLEPLARMEIKFGLQRIIQDLVIMI